VKLNLGCGPMKFEGWVNIDFDEAYEPDLVADIAKLPMEDDSVDAIYAAHVLEHFHWKDPVLEEWHRVLRPGGVIVQVVPDLVQVVELWQSGTGLWGYPEVHPMDIDYVHAVVYGGAGILGPWGPGQVHKQIFIGTMLRDRLAELFPDAHDIEWVRLGEDCVRYRQAGEAMATGTKP